VAKCIRLTPCFNLIEEIVEGGAAGVDALARRFAVEHNIPFKTFPANWMLHGPAAGPIRNKEMAAYASALDHERSGILIAIPAENSKGTVSMIREADKAGLTVFVHAYHELPT